MRTRSHRGFSRHRIGSGPSNINFLGPFSMQESEPKLEQDSQNGSVVALDVHEVDRRLTEMFDASDEAIDALVHEHRDPQVEPKMADLAITVFTRAQAVVEVASAITQPPEPERPQ